MAPGMKMDFDYLNPNFSVEGRNVGFGFGAIIGQVPVSFGHSGTGKISVSGHLRAGNLRKVHFITSLAENTPLISGGGLLNLGLGYSIGKNVRMFSGLTAGFYDMPGFLQQGQFRVSRKLDAEISFRVGQTENAFEGSASGGLIYRIGGK